MSLHLQQVSQEDTLECRLEIPTNYSSSEQPACLNMQPQRDQYNNVLAKDSCMVAFVKRLYYMISGLWIFWTNLHKANFILYFQIKTF
jgi:hypothetical protein